MPAAARRDSAPTKPHTETGWSPSLTKLATTSVTRASTPLWSVPVSQVRSPHARDGASALVDIGDPRKICLKGPAVGASRENSPATGHPSKTVPRSASRPSALGAELRIFSGRAGIIWKARRSAPAKKPLRHAPYCVAFAPAQSASLVSPTDPPVLAYGTILPVSRPSTVRRGMERRPFTDDQWVDIVQAALQGVPTQKPVCATPDVGAPEFAKLIDHTLLKLDATEEQIDDLCAEARRYGFKSCCVRPNYVRRAASKLEGSDVVVACVVGFHEGTQPTADKVREARAAVADGAQELDMVLNYQLLHDRAYSALFQSIEAVREAAPAPVVLKCILETSQLSEHEIVAGSIIAAEAGVDFVKTSTGFNGAGARAEDVALMANVAREKGVRVKASGGIRSLADCVKMVEAGAQRLGTSSGVRIIEEARGAKGDEAPAEAAY
ncbi:MAG: hypothetical protein M1832_004586 [Thelocarpon impressellum]|nr:MAG: hypothetical protein M1832_004586 [Thelocarpon impressellum]